jgi:hypothetical protein
MNDCKKTAELFTGHATPDALRVVRVRRNHRIDENTDVVDVREEDVTLTLPDNPKPGQTVRVLASSEGAVSVRGGCHPISGIAPVEDADDDDDDDDDDREGCGCSDRDNTTTMLVPSNTSATFTFDTRGRKRGAWLPELSGATSTLLFPFPTDANQTLTADQSAASAIVLSGTLTAPRTITSAKTPSTSNQVLVRNNTTQNVTFQ